MLLLGGAFVIGISACGQNDQDAAEGSTAASPSVASSLSTPSLTEDQSVETCSVTEGGGTYYLNVTSRTAGDLSACAGGTRMAGDLDAIFAIPNVDRRCIISPPTPYEAIVGVYSDTKKADLSAARARCALDHGSTE